MVTTVETKEQVGAAAPTLEELGAELGIPIKVRPWWGSRRARNNRIHKRRSQEKVNRSGAWHLLTG